MRKILIALIVTCFVVIGCKNEAKEAKKETAIAAENVKETSFKVSGMTCEIGCAKTIQSKLAKKEGVVDAKVVFTDSIATVKFDASKTNQKDLMAFVNGIADGNTYKTCKTDCKKECNKGEEVRPENCMCEGCKGKSECSSTCKNECNTKKEKKASNNTACEKECCAKA